GTASVISRGASRRTSAPPRRRRSGLEGRAGREGRRRQVGRRKAEGARRGSGPDGAPVGECRERWERQRHRSKEETSCEEVRREREGPRLFRCAQLRRRPEGEASGAQQRGHQGKAHLRAVKGKGQGLEKVGTHDGEKVLLPHPRRKGGRQQGDRRHARRGKRRLRRLITPRSMASTASTACECVPRTVDGLHCGTLSRGWQRKCHVVVAKEEVVVLTSLFSIIPGGGVDSMISHIMKYCRECSVLASRMRFLLRGEGLARAAG
ncbi:unnamed protein product, partial [Scytosiphon promiscuus]